MKNKLWKSLLTSAVVAVLVVVSLFGYAVIHYLYTSPRFEVRNVLVSGLNRVKQIDVVTMADLPESANAFSVNLEKVRERVEQLDWVRFATVQRVLPDTISIRVVERNPAGLALLRGEILQFDEEAHLLNRDREAGAAFPILTGLTPRDLQKNRQKVELYVRVVDELHGKKEFSEVHINDAMEVSVISVSVPILVTLGKEKFKERWEQFQLLRSRIQAEHPDTVQVDFRFKAQVILRKMVPDEQKVIWDEEKKSL